MTLSNHIALVLPLFWSKALTNGNIHEPEKKLRILFELTLRLELFLKLKISSYYILHRNRWLNGTKYTLKTMIEQLHKILPTLIYLI